MLVFKKKTFQALHSAAFYLGLGPQLLSKFCLISSLTWIRRGRRSFNWCWNQCIGWFATDDARHIRNYQFRCRRNGGGQDWYGISDCGCSSIRWKSLFRGIFIENIKDLEQIHENTRIRLWNTFWSVQAVAGDWTGYHVAFLSPIRVSAALIQRKSGGNIGSRGMYTFLNTFNSFIVLNERRAISIQG